MIVSPTALTMQEQRQLIAHAGGVHLFLLLLLEIADAVDGGERGLGIVHPNTHGVVLIVEGGTRLGITIEDVVALRHKTPFPVA